MRFEFENLGPIDSGSVELNDLTVICGPNNTGKTYVSNCIYGLINTFRGYDCDFISEENAEELVLNGKYIVDLSDRINENSLNVEGVSESFCKGLPSFFSTSPDFFKKTSISIDENMAERFLTTKLSYEFSMIDDDSILIEKSSGSYNIEIYHKSFSDETVSAGFLHVLINRILSESFYKDPTPKPFIVTTERTGIGMFYKEIDERRSEIFNNISDRKGLIKKIRVGISRNSRYAEPIQDNINSIRRASDICKRNSFLVDEEKYSDIFECISEIISGKFSVEDNDVEYHPKAEEGRESVAVPFNLTSSSVKSMFLIDLYVRYLAEEGAVLVIDEPELNLHPKNQRKMAELVAKLVNSGIKIVVTTHSDYFIRELNNRIMLSNSFSGKETIMKEYGLNDFDIIDQNRVKAYSLNNHVITESLIDKFGMNLELFDDVINESNELSDTLYFSIEGAGE